MADDYTPTVEALNDVWSALGCAHNPDDFKPEVRRAMWAQALTMISQAVTQTNRVYRENQALLADRLTVAPDLATLTAWFHASNEFNYDDCQHGTYAGGPSHGEPYAMCERFARQLLASGVLGVPADRCTCDGGSYYTTEKNGARHPLLVNGDCPIHGHRPAVERTADRETIAEAIVAVERGFAHMDPGVALIYADAVLAVLVPADQVRAEALEAEADRIRSVAKESAEAQRTSDLEEGLPLIGTSTANEVEWYQMGNWAEGLLRARAAEYRKAAGA